jgi:D-aspartate ligase
MTIKGRCNQALFKDTSIPVVVLKANTHGSLGIARSLGRLGVTVRGIDQNPWAPALHSRYFREKLVWDIDTAAPETIIQYLLDVGKSIGKRSILIATADETAVLLADYADILKEWYIFPHLSSRLIRTLTNKKEMYFLAKRMNVPTAETCFPQSRMDVERYLEHAKFPIMLKTIYGHALQLRAGLKNLIVKTKEELLELYDRYEDPVNPNFMLQEYIPGGDESVWMFNGYFNEKSECLFGITGKKIRQSPPNAGITSLGICLTNKAIVEMTTRFMKSIGYKGMLDIGYRYDKRDGNYKVLDVNPRIGCTFRLFVGDNGLDVARVEYLDLSGQLVPLSRIIEGRKWVVEDADFFSSPQYHLDEIFSLRQWAASYRGIQETAWFALDDILPFFMMCMRSASTLFSLAIKSIRVLHKQEKLY